MIIKNKVAMKQFAFLLLSVFLVACDGYEYDDSDSGSGGGGSGSDLKFTSSELVDKILFSDQIQSSNIKESFILRFESSSRLEQILIQSDTTALSGKYAWTIVNDKIQVTYPSAVVCTTTKTKDNNSKFETTGSCTGGTPINAIIKGDLIKPISFTNTSLNGKEITIDLDNNLEEILKFDSSGTSFTTTKKDNGQATNPENGTFKKSVYTNVVRLDFPSNSEYRLLVLVKDNLSDGRILELRYGASDNVLKAIRVYSTSNNNWDLEEIIITIAKETT